MGVLELLGAVKTSKQVAKDEFGSISSSKPLAISVSRECSFTSMYSIVLVGICNLLSCIRELTYCFKTKGELPIHLILIEKCLTGFDTSLVS